MKAPEVIKGDCEACEKTDQVLTVSYGMKLCPSCLSLQTAATESAVNNVISDVKTSLEPIQLKTDIHNAETPALMDIRTRIEQDNSIPAELKEVAFCNACIAQMQHFQKIAFDAREAANKADESARVWQLQVQTTISQLRGDLRETYKGLNINYSPTPVKSVKKAAKEKTPKTRASAKFNVKELYAAAEKYGVDANATRSIMVARNLSADDAAKELAKLLGK
jgi:uncharacterized protein (UPF0335 family)